jgi:L-asparaginase
MPRAKIAVLYVGGSIGMIRNVKTGRMENLESLAEIHRFLPELQREVALQFFSLSNLGSSDITHEHWMEIAHTIEKYYDDFEGFVVIHGTNTMSYTAAALTFALQHLSKPIVLTGALSPINDPASDGRLNLIFAIRAAQLDIAEVCIVIGPTILRGSRAVKIEQSMLQAFQSPNFPSLGSFSTGLHLDSSRTVRRKRTLHAHINFDPNVLSLTLHPGMMPAQLDALLTAKPHGIVLSSYGLGMLPEQLFPWLTAVMQRGIPVLLTSQMLKGKIDLHLYRKQIMLEQLGIISGMDMTYECSVVKMMWALTQTKNPAKLRTLLERNLTGELSDEEN